MTGYYWQARDSTWMHQAACVGHDPRLFEDARHVRRALMVCRDCPVRTPCRDTRPYRAMGVWGGRAYYPRRKKVS